MELLKFVLVSFLMAKIQRLETVHSPYNNEIKKILIIIHLLFSTAPICHSVDDT